MNKISQGQQQQINLISEKKCLNFPTKKQIFCLCSLFILQLEAILIKIPIQSNSSNAAFLVSQIILVSIVLYSWFKTISIDSGLSVIRQFQFANQQQTRRRPRNIKTKFSNKQSFCEVCKIKKDQTILHCKKCNKCVLDFYFHANWLNTCIGRYNFTSFIALIIFVIIYQILLLISNLSILINSQNQVRKQFLNNASLSQFAKITNQIFVALLSILVVVTLIILILQSQKLRKHKIQKKCLIKKINVEGKWNLNQQQIEQNNEQITQANIQTSSIKRLQYHENTLCSLQYDQPSMFKTNFFSSSDYFNRKKQSLQIKCTQNPDQLDQDKTNFQKSRNKKSPSRQYSDSFQSQNMRFQQLLQIQKNKQDKKTKQNKVQIKTSKFYKQNIQNSDEISLDSIKTKLKLYPQKNKPLPLSIIGYKIIKGKRKSISKMEEDPVWNQQRNKFNLFKIKRKDSLKEESQQQKKIHRVSKMSH